MLSPQEQQALDLLLKKQEASTEPTVKSVKFTNWTDEDFTWPWAKVPYTVKAHETITLQDWLANHLAKHLAERELNRENNILVQKQKDQGIKPQDRQEINIVFSPLRQQYIERAIGTTVSTAANPEELASKMMNEPEVLTQSLTADDTTISLPVAKKPGRPKKEVFEGLNETTDKK